MVAPLPLIRYTPTGVIRFKYIKRTWPFTSKLEIQVQLSVESCRTAPPFDVQKVLPYTWRVADGSDIKKYGHAILQVGRNFLVPKIL